MTKGLFFIIYYFFFLDINAPPVAINVPNTPTTVAEVPPVFGNLLLPPVVSSGLVSDSGVSGLTGASGLTGTSGLTGVSGSTGVSGVVTLSSTILILEYVPVVVNSLSFLSITLTSFKTDILVLASPIAFKVIVTSVKAFSLLSVKLIVNNEPSTK